MRLKSIPQLDSWEPQLLQSLLDTPDLRFLWAMQETSGTQAKDYSGNARHGTYDGITINQFAPNRRINKSVLFDGINDRIITPLTCSVRGLGLLTLACTIEILNTGTNREIYYESTDVISSGRLIFRIGVDRKISVLIRSKTSTQTLTTVSTVNVIPVGFCVLHATIDIAQNIIKIYRNGIEITVTGVVNLESAIIDDTAPAGINFGVNAAQTANWLSGRMAYFAQWSRVLTPTEILQHSKSGGFA